MQVNTYLTFNGQCEAAFKFYEQCLGGKIEAMMTHGESPMANQVSSEWQKKILHARLMIQQTLWAARFGMLIDRFGIPWMVNCEQAA